MKFHGETDAYRIGWWTHRWWPRSYNLYGLLTGCQRSPRADNGSRRVGRAVWLRQIVNDLRLIRWPHRPWQAESEQCRFARRAFTASGARRKILRDEVAAQAGGLSRHQSRRTRSARARAVMASIRADA